MANLNIIPPAYVITDTDKAGLVIVVTTFLLASIIICFFVRIFIRITINRPWKWDDWCITVATFLSIVRSAFVYRGVRDGYGKSASLLCQDHFHNIGQTVFASTILHIIALFFSKAAVLFLCKRLATNPKHETTLWAILVLCAVWAVMSILLVTIGCKPGHALIDLPSQCHNISARARTICSVDIFTEAVIFASCISLVYGVRMSRLLKSVVILAFAIRLPSIAFSAVRLASVLYVLRSSDPTIEGVYSSVWAQAELDYSIMACTFSLLGAFLKPFTKEMGPSRSNSYPLNSANSSSNRQRSRIGLSVPTAAEFNLFRPSGEGQSEAEATARSGDGRRESLETAESHQGTILKKVQWFVARDAAQHRDLGSRGHS
ncbi:hypothetical protein VTL71DRAFT_13054 [Oculimacula yallundae]|uniref:Rhodopsin domain-containing protein n=1 Tax=Oculimacula yallundae TaxID=86028 RepID=A0ABR4CPR1_9HELO